jgi:hypothetical protein
MNPWSVRTIEDMWESTAKRLPRMIRYVDRYFAIEPRLGISKGNIFDHRSATPQKTNSFSNFPAMASRFKNRFLPLILILFSCVENKIFIQVHPDGQTYFRFESRGDSTDIFDSDFLHPQNIPGWTSTSRVLENKGEEENNWVLSTEGISRDTVLLFFNNDPIPLGYSFHRTSLKTFLSSEYNISLKFEGRKIKNDFPKLYEAILSEKSDSLYWLPEALTVLMHKGLKDIAHDSLSPNQMIWNQRLVNHLRNSFARVTTLEEFEKIQNNRIAYLTDLLKPFHVDPSLPLNLGITMENHEKILNTSLDLNDDSFEVKIILPGQIVTTNATEILGDTLMWQFGLDSLLSKSFELKAESVIFATDGIQKTLISIGILFLVLLGIFIKIRL